ncbi:hypothetical protein IU510_04375 [Nocardia cyriacigeorgica]|nr:hypothetical protein [Nocardia cyriacigeorgica]MBF6160892.1 hypothetical protein [Nocardia cyriacigeorgica]MBF6201117.1 hypothetical protein [Nocardia cyriacigeorgica]MBF6318778.1 hypothetical protein [Nocardia cyriacigeorgica]MBF6513363.1 hypothetical protein [Nocardia cyriacigeorgica]
MDRHRPILRGRSGAHSTDNPDPHREVSDTFAAAARLAQRSRPEPEQVESWALRWMHGKLLQSPSPPHSRQSR